MIPQELRSNKHLNGHILRRDIEPDRSLLPPFPSQVASVRWSEAKLPIEVACSIVVVGYKVKLQSLAILGDMKFTLQAESSITLTFSTLAFVGLCIGAASYWISPDLRSDLPIL